MREESRFDTHERVRPWSQSPMQRESSHFFSERREPSAVVALIAIDFYGFLVPPNQGFFFVWEPLRAAAMSCQPTGLSAETRRYSPFFSRMLHRTEQTAILSQYARANVGGMRSIVPGCVPTRMSFEKKGRNRATVTAWCSHASAHQFFRFFVPPVPWTIGSMNSNAVWARDAASLSSNGIARDAGAYRRAEGRLLGASTSPAWRRDSGSTAS